jgi:phosphoglycolate phosphatase
VIPSQGRNAVKKELKIGAGPGHERLNLLFDLDGTLTDSKAAVIHSIQSALKRVGHPDFSPKDLEGCVGPPLAESFTRLLGDGDLDRVEEAISYYKQSYEIDGIFEIQPYDGIADCLRELGGSANLYVATSNLTSYTEKILSRYSLERCFRGIYGCPDFTRMGKGELIGNLIKREKLDSETVVMIGDRKYDILGARENHISSLGVLWGYGTKEELLTAGADAVFSHPRDLSRFFRERVPGTEINRGRERLFSIRWFFDLLTDLGI